jgi:P pilus assembly chaperone PapD
MQRAPNLVAILLAAIVLASLPVPAHAQQGLKVWPTKVELSVNRGEAATATVNVHNEGAEPATVHAYVMDFCIDRDGRFVFTDPGHESYSASAWLSVDNTDLELEAGESQEIEVVVAVPTDLEPGGHYAAVFFETGASANEEGVPISTRIPSLFYITVPGATDADVCADAKIVSLILPRFVEQAPVQAGVVVKNTGNVHLTVAATAYFKGLSAKSSSLDLQQMTLLPDGEGTLRGKWEELPYIGRVSASIVIGYFDEQGDVVNKSQTGEFFVIPWKQLAAILIAVVLVVAVVVLSLRTSRLRSQREKETRPPS